MYPFLNLFGKAVSLYGIMFIIAAAVSISFALIRAKKRGINTDDTLYMSLFAVIGAVIGAKLLYIITLIPPVISNWNNVMQSDTNIWKILLSLFTSGGFVFFGGLIGGITGGVIYLKIYNLNIYDFVDLVVPCIPLAHAIGRIGCFFAGCCYGIESRFGIELNRSPIAPHGVRLLPVQLLEACVNILLICIILIYENGRKNTRKEKSLILYLASYSIARFILEFFRGDISRGFIFGASTSQIISIVLFSVTIFSMMFSYKNQSGRKR